MYGDGPQELSRWSHLDSRVKSNASSSDGTDRTDGGLNDSTTDVQGVRGRDLSDVTVDLPGTTTVNNTDVVVDLPKPSVEAPPPMVPLFPELRRPTV